MKLKFKVNRIEARTFPESGEVHLVKLIPEPAGIGDLLVSIKDGTIEYHPETLEDAPKMGEGAKRVAIKKETLIRSVTAPDGTVFTLEGLVDVDVSTSVAAPAKT